MNRKVKKEEETVKTTLSFEELMKKALNTPLPKGEQAKKKAAKKKK